MPKAYCLNTAAPKLSSSSLIAARPVGPGVVLESVGTLKVAAVVVPTSGVAPGPTRAVPPLARPMCVSVLIAEGEAVVALAPPGVLAAEALVLVVEALVLKVAVEPVVVVVVEGLSVTAVATVWLLPTKEAAKESWPTRAEDCAGWVGHSYLVSGSFLPGACLLLLPLQVQP